MDSRASSPRSQAPASVSSPSTQAAVGLNSSGRCLRNASFRALGLALLLLVATLLQLPALPHAATNSETAEPKPNTRSLTHASSRKDSAGRGARRTPAAAVGYVAGDREHLPPPTGTGSHLRGVGSGVVGPGSAPRSNRRLLERRQLQLASSSTSSNTRPAPPPPRPPLAATNASAAAMNTPAAIGSAAGATLPQNGSAAGRAPDIAVRGGATPVLPYTGAYSSALLRRWTSGAAVLLGGSGHNDTTSNHNTSACSICGTHSAGNTSTSGTTTGTGTNNVSSNITATTNRNSSNNSSSSSSSSRAGDPASALAASDAATAAADTSMSVVIAQQLAAPRPGSALQSVRAQLQCVRDRDPALPLSDLQPLNGITVGPRQYPDPEQGLDQDPDQDTDDGEDSDSNGTDSGSKLGVPTPLSPSTARSGAVTSLGALGMLVSETRSDRCTGALISQCHILTAGHCIYGFQETGGGDNKNDSGSSSGKEDSWVRSWAFTPGWNGMRAPYGTYYSRTAAVPPQLVELGDPSYDLGLIMLSRSVPASVGPFFQLEDPSDVDPNEEDPEVKPLGGSAVNGSSKCGAKGAVNGSSSSSSSSSSSGGAAGGAVRTPSVTGLNESTWGPDDGGAASCGDQTGAAPVYQVRTIDGVAVIVSTTANDNDGGSAGGGGSGLPSSPLATTASDDGGASGGDDDEDLDGDAPCLNYAGYPTPLLRWAQYCRYMSELDDHNFVETSCRGRPGVSGAPLWIYEAANTTVSTSSSTSGKGSGNSGNRNSSSSSSNSTSSTTSGGSNQGVSSSNNNITGGGKVPFTGQLLHANTGSRSSSSSSSSNPPGVAGRRIVRAVLTAGVPGGPTAAVRIDHMLVRWVREWQAKNPCS